MICVVGWYLAKFNGCRGPNADWLLLLWQLVAVDVNIKSRQSRQHGCGWQQGCGVGRFFRIPTPTPDSDSSSFEKPTSTPDSDSSSFKKPTPTPDSDSSIFENPTPTPDSDSSSFKKPTPTPDSDSSWKHATPPTPTPDSDSTTLAVTAVVAASYL